MQLTTLAAFLTLLTTTALALAHAATAAAPVLPSFPPSLCTSSAPHLLTSCLRPQPPCSCLQARHTFAAHRLHRRVTTFDLCELHLILRPRPAHAHYHNLERCAAKLPSPTFCTLICSRGLGTMIRLLSLLISP